MAQGDIVERLYYVPKTKAVDLALILDLSQQSVVNSLRRLKKHRYVIMNESFQYSLTKKGVEFFERYFQ